MEGAPPLSGDGAKGSGSIARRQTDDFESYKISSGIILFCCPKSSFTDELPHLSPDRELAQMKQETNDEIKHVTATTVFQCMCSREG